MSDDIRPARMLRSTSDQDSLLRDAARGDGWAVDRLAATLDEDPIELSAEVLSVKRVAAGVGVSYGHTHVTTSATTLALVYLGYGHGLPRKAGNRAHVTWHDRSGAVVRMPIIGRVAMDVLVVDAGDAPVDAGDRIVVFGDGAAGDIPLTGWAADVAEPPVSVLAALDRRVTRRSTTDPGAAGTDGAMPDATRGGGRVPTSARLAISRDALRHNVRVIRDRVRPAELMAVVKDDAYGHGLQEVVRVLAAEQVARFGALDLATAHRVLELAPQARVFVWVLAAGDDLDAAIGAGVELGIGDAPTLERVAAADGRAVVHLKVDSGLHRAGVLPSRWPAFVARAAELERAGRIRVVGLWTHIAEASDESDSDSIAVFLEAIAQADAAGLTPEVRHLAASAASSARADARFDLVRVAAFLLGIAPGGGTGPDDVGIRPVATLTARVAEVRDGRATVDLGGVHGILSDAAGVVDVVVRGSRYPIVQVEPTHLIVAIGDSGVAPGDEVVLFGDGESGAPTLQEWADAMGTIGEEIVTRLSAEIPRDHV